MKALLALAALGFAIPALAAFTQEGVFQRPHTIAFLNYSDEKECTDDNGRWDDGVCTMDAEDSVEVKKEGEALRVQVSTITTSAHTCDFDGLGKLTGEREILASTDTEEYVPGQDGKDGTFVPAVCQVKVSYADDNTVDVSVVGRAASCETLCGANAMLEINGAKRK